MAVVIVDRDESDLGKSIIKAVDLLGGLEISPELDVNRIIPPEIIFIEHGKKILCSRNTVEVDAIAATLSGIDPLKIGYLNLAKSIGLGENQPERIEVIT